MISGFQNHLRNFLACIYISYDRVNLICSLNLHGPCKYLGLSRSKQMIWYSAHILQTLETTCCTRNARCTYHVLCSFTSFRPRVLIFIRFRFRIHFTWHPFLSSSFWHQTNWSVQISKFETLFLSECRTLTSDIWKIM